MKNKIKTLLMLALLHAICSMILSLMLLRAVKMLDAQFLAKEGCIFVAICTVSIYFFRIVIDVIKKEDYYE